MQNTVYTASSNPPCTRAAYFYRLSMGWATNDSITPDDAIKLLAEMRDEESATWFLLQSLGLQGINPNKVLKALYGKKLTDALIMQLGKLEKSTGNFYAARILRAYSLTDHCYKDCKESVRKIAEGGL